MLLGFVIIIILLVAPMIHSFYITRIVTLQMLTYPDN